MPEAVSRAYAVAYRMTGSAADAEEATTAALLTGDVSDADGLLHTTVRAVLDLRRARPAGRGRPAPARASRANRSASLEAAIAALPPAERDPFVLAEVEQLPAAAVGELLGLDVSEVGARLHRARLSLCAALRGCG